jgi:DMSO/TMAO reductase YedYZ molybdopterin-dependent catalytic subunit
MKHLKTLLFLLVMMALLLAACAPQGTPVLKASGNVTSEKSWTDAQLKKLGTVNADYIDKEGVTTTYTGVPIVTLLDEAGIKDGSTAVVFVASDGYTAETTLEELQACKTCIVAFDDDGSLRTVMPDFSGKLQVKMLTEMQVK